MKREAFKTHIAEMFDKLAFEILAEEFSEECKGQSDVGEEEAIRKKVATKLVTAPEPLNWETVFEQFRKAKGIEHPFCDPTFSEKQALSIEVDPRKKTESDRDKRERFWLSKIADCKRRRVLFVCGDDHFDAFAQLLESNGFNVRRGAHYPVSNEEFFAHVPDAPGRLQQMQSPNLKAHDARLRSPTAQR